MSLLSHDVAENELVGDAYDPSSSLYDQHFGLGLLNNGLHRRSTISASSSPILTSYFRSRRHVNPEDSGMSTISNEKDEFKVYLDVQQFEPEEMNVKVVDQCYLVVEGKHEERQDKHGFISRQFIRKYKLPQNVNLEKIECNLSSGGIISITAPKEVETTKGKEISIPVTQTNQPNDEESNKPSEAKAGGDEMEV